MPLAREVVNRAVLIQEELESLKGEVVGHLKLGCSTATGKYILPHLLARFRCRHPRVHITIYNHNRNTVLNQLDAAAIQLAVVSSQPNGAEVVFRHFFTDFIVLIVPTDHPWASRRHIVPDELLHTPFILRSDPQSGTRQEVEAALAAVGLNPAQLDLVMEIGNSEAISMAVEEGMGAAFVSRTVARRGIELGRIKEVQVAGLSLKREVFIAYSQRHPATRAQTEFWNFVQEPDNQHLLQLAT
jgi:DNA-binding transcriptional LysR family regulator